MESNCEITPKPKSVKEFFRSRYFWRPFLAVIVGAAGGYLYYHFIGCTTGSCPLTGTPVGSILTGSTFGLFLVYSPCSGCR